MSPLRPALLASALLTACLPGRPDPQVEAGRRIFREGLLPDGSHTTAVAYTDVKLSGAQVSCANCHGRSGMGTAETGTRTPPITGPLLFNPAARPSGPIYNRQTLARALRGGVDSAGAALSPLMPRYDLSDDALDALDAYLRTLSATPPPGLDDQQLTIAIPLDAALPAETQAAILAVLQRFVDDHNADTRNETGRNAARIEEGRTRRLFRTWHLRPWRLQGAPDTWEGQLDDYLDEEPVFALVGGRSARPWDAVHHFCEREAIPCLFPAVDRATPQPGDFYALYFTAGLDIEAAVIAQDILAAGHQAQVIQLVDPADASAQAAAQQLASRLAAAQGAATTLAPDAPRPPGATALVAWVPAAALPDLRAETAPLYLSGTRLGPDRPALPATLVDARATHRGRDPALLRFTAWAKARDIAIVDEAAQSQTWFAAMAFFDGMEHIATHPSRDYLLDTLDHSSGLAAVLPGYPEGEFGPGQRILSKGAFLLPPEGPARWVLP